MKDNSTIVKFHFKRLKNSHEQLNSDILKVQSFTFLSVFHYYLQRFSYKESCVFCQRGISEGNSEVDKKAIAFI